MTQKSTLHANFLLLQKALAVWSPVGDHGDQGTTTAAHGEKSPESVATSPESAAAASSAAPTSAAMAVTGTQAGLAHWMSFMAEHMNSAESGTPVATTGAATATPIHPYVWQNGMEVGRFLRPWVSG